MPVKIYFYGYTHLNTNVLYNLLKLFWVRGTQFLNRLYTIEMYQFKNKGRSVTWRWDISPNSFGYKKVRIRHATAVQLELGNFITTERVQNVKIGAVDRSNGNKSECDTRWHSSNGKQVSLGRNELGIRYWAKVAHA